MFWNKKKSKKVLLTKNYADVTDFVENNIAMVKTLLSPLGSSDKSRRLGDIAQMIDCHAVLLCAKEHESPDGFTVVVSSDTNYAAIGTVFTWQHLQVAASSDAVGLISALPFQHVGAQGFISVPVKDKNNITVGILLGLATKRLENIDAKTRLLHMLAPSFCVELRCERLKQQRAQFEQRIVSLNQSLEVMNADIAREKERSQENKELKSIFLTNLSHEIRTPMNAILGFVDLLDMAQSDEERSEFIKIIKQNSKLLLAVIDNLVEISKLQSSYMFSPACPRQLNALLDSIRKDLEGKVKLSGKPIEVVTSYALQTPNDTIWNSEEIISKVFDYLIDNALKFTESGRISFGYQTDEKEMRFYVRDTGCGIKKGEEESIFQMFCIGDNGVPMPHDTNDMSSKGLGLTLAQKYVALTGGRIWADPNCEVGACIYFCIPNDKL